MCQPRTLPPTRTFPTPGQRRSYWFPACRRWEFDGVLAIEQGAKPAKCYAVEQDAEGWLVAKLDAEGDVYRVSVGPGGWRCSCKGAVCHYQEFRCCHVDAMREHYEAGDLDAVPETFDGEGSGLWVEDSEGEPTVYELEAAHAH